MMNNVKTFRLGAPVFNGIISLQRHSFLHFACPFRFTIQVTTTNFTQIKDTEQKALAKSLAKILKLQKLELSNDSIKIKKKKRGIKKKKYLTNIPTVETL
uniref:Uncharacterized protein n=1 Tax=Cacopsylla melanoneura TaxID=428564 RepID=A0A8D9F4H6_9HEMI